MITPPQALEAVLFAANGPLSKKELTGLFSCTAEELGHIVHALSEELSSRGITLVETDTELELRTAKEAAELVKRLRTTEVSRDIGKASLETLAVIAYQNGATRGEIDWVRGVNSSASVRTLLLRGLIDRSEDPSDKRRIVYTLSTEALAHLGVSAAAALPRYEEFSMQTKARIDTASEAAAPEAARQS